MQCSRTHMHARHEWGVVITTATGQSRAAGLDLPEGGIAGECCIAQYCIGVMHRTDQRGAQHLLWGRCHAHLLHRSISLLHIVLCQRLCDCHRHHSRTGHATKPRCGRALLLLICISVYMYTCMYRRGRCMRLRVPELVFADTQAEVPACPYNGPTHAFVFCGSVVAISLLWPPAAACNYEYRVCGLRRPQGPLAAPASKIPHLAQNAVSGPKPRQHPGSPIG